MATNNGNGQRGGGQQRPPQQQQRQQERQLTAIEQRKAEQVELTRSFGAMVAALEPNMVEVMPKGGDAAKLRRMAITAVQRNPDLLQCSRESWITSLTLCAQDGLMPDGREAAFVKFGGTGGPTVQYMPMVYGLRKKMLQSGEIRDIFTAVVYAAEFEAELFEVTFGSDPKIFHKPLLGNADRGDIIAAYSVATFKDGTRSFEVMTAADIEKIRMVSQTGKKNEGPWRDWYGEMCRKTVLRRHSKSLPMSSDLRDVEVEHMFDAGEFAKRIAPGADDKGVGGGPARTAQIGSSANAPRLDELEEKAFGAQVAIEPEGAEMNGGELVDKGTGEVLHRGNAQEQQVLEPDEEDAANLRGTPETGADAQVEQEGASDSAAGATDDGAGATVDEDAPDPELLAAENREADRIILVYQKAPNVIDLKGARDDNLSAIDAMSEEPAGRVNRAFDNAMKKLGGKS